MELPRGMRDFDYDDLARIEFVRERFTRMAKIFSFRLMDPSPLELLETLEKKSGAAIRDEIYHFTDKGGRDVALRFDFTVGLTRHVASERSMRFPAKIGSFGGVFRYDEPQKGRYRFFHQWNVEIFGRPTLESESEVIEFASRMFESLGLDGVEIHLNHRSLVESFVRENYPGFDPAVAERVFADSFRFMDKVPKKPAEALIHEYSHMPREFLLKMLEFASIRGAPDQIESRVRTDLLDSWGYLRQLWDSLQNRSVKNVMIDFGIVRGLDYYSGVVFEIFDGQSDLGALAGGGRYDSLTSAFGRSEIGAIGIAGGVERTILALVGRGKLDCREAPQAAILYVNEETRDRAFHLASALRSRGISTEIDLAGRSLKKQLEACKSRFAIIVGPRELKENHIVLRDMEQRTESTISIDDLISAPGRFLIS